MTNAPLRDGALEVTTGTEVTANVTPATDQDTEPRCLLCPICACGYPCCRVAVAS